MESRFRAEPKQPNFLTVGARRECTAAELKTQRKSRRDDVFNRQRAVENFPAIDEAHQPVINTRVRQLEIWKRSRLMTEKGNKSKGKIKPFIVSVVHHNVGSPYKRKSLFKSKVQPAVQAATSDRKPVNVKVRPATKPPAARCLTRAMSKARTQREPVPLVSKAKLQPALVTKNFKFKPPKGIEPLSMEVQTTLKGLAHIFSPFTKKLESNGAGTDQISTPLTKARKNRVKGSAKKPTPSVGNTQPSPQNITQKSDRLLMTSTPHQQQTDVSGYRKELKDVIEQLENLCNEWSCGGEMFASLPTEVRDLIDVAVGQTKLLIKEKLAQYRGLINDCEANSKAVKVTESDLQGFWEMVNIQVRDVLSKFDKLSVLKENNWEEKEECRNPIKKSKTVSKTKKKTIAKSSVRDHIAVLRRAKAVLENTEPKTPNVRNSMAVESVSRRKSTRRVGADLTSDSPVGVLNRVQLSEKRERMKRLSTTMMKVTDQVKDIGTPEVKSQVKSECVEEHTPNAKFASRSKRSYSSSDPKSDKNVKFGNENRAATEKKKQLKSAGAGAGKLEKDMFSAKVILKDIVDFFENHQTRTEDTQNSCFGNSMTATSFTDKENLHDDNAEPHTTPPLKTYSRSSAVQAHSNSPVKSSDVNGSEMQFELLKNTRVFEHRRGSYTTSKDKLSLTTQQTDKKRQKLSFDDARNGASETEASDLLQKSGMRETRSRLKSHR